MENDFNDEDFEFFLKQKVDHYKMYPSENVWKNVHGFLHTRRRWFTIGGSLLILTGLFFVAQEFVFSGLPHASIENNSATIPTFSAPEQSPASSKNTTTLHSGSAAIEKGTTTQNIKPIVAHPGTPNTADDHQSVDIVSLNTTKDRNIQDLNTTSTEPLAAGINIHTLDPSKLNISAPGANPPASDSTGSLLGANVSSSLETGSVIDEDAAPQKEINWLQELAVIKLTAKKKSNFNLQFYFSPTISYRILADNGNSNSAHQNIPLAASHESVDRYVDHKPSIGAELGSNVLYSVSRNLTLKTGLQLNYSRYNIQAYKFYSEKASIALNSMGPVADTLTTMTSFRNFSGYYPEELQNQYLQVSLPVGAELKLLGNKRLQFSIAGTLQPTYLLFNNTYLLSSDYVNYTKEPSLVRKWNIHTSVEAYVSYETAGLRWQVGPQFRYQLMSSYKNLYSIREYLMEYGVKFGVSKTLR